MRLALNGLALLALLVAGPALAQKMPPARVGRIALVDGTIAFHMQSDTEWSKAGLNYPVASGGSFWTDPQSRAQLRIGPDTIDMDHNTEVDITLLDERAMQISVPQGRIELHLHKLENDQSAEIDIARGSVRVLREGVYDIAAGGDDEPSRVAVFSGRTRIFGNGLDAEVRRGNAAVLAGTNPVTVSYERAEPDEFADWCRRHEYAVHIAATHYIPPTVTGYADLDQYGRWQEIPEYGHVWFPTAVSVGWAPYREGRWVWIEPWGWTWVDNEPWGFAPFHYGRWARYHDHWCWVPGRYVVHPVYAPALVAFVGGSAAGLSVAVGGGPVVGWFPLAPDEVYWPSYSRDPQYVRELNRPVVRNITTIVNRTVINNQIVIEQNGQRGGVVKQARFANRQFATVVPKHVFVQAQRVGPSALSTSNPQIRRLVRQAPVHTRPPVQQAVAKPAQTAKPGPVTKKLSVIGRQPLHAAVAKPPAVRHHAGPSLAPAVVHAPSLSKTPTTHAAPGPTHPSSAALPSRIEKTGPAHQTTAPTPTPGQATAPRTHVPVEHGPPAAAHVPHEPAPRLLPGGVHSEQHEPASGRAPEILHGAHPLVPKPHTAPHEPARGRAPEIHQGAHPSVPKPHTASHSAPRSSTQGRPREMHQFARPAVPQPHAAFHSVPHGAARGRPSAIHQARPSAPRPHPAFQSTLHQSGRSQHPELHRTARPSAPRPHPAFHANSSRRLVPAPRAPANAASHTSRRPVRARVHHAGAAQ